MTNTELITTTTAVLLSPLVALQVQRWLDSSRDKRGRRAALFNVLMATRAARVSPAHVEALNRIDIEYYGSFVGGYRRQSARDKAVSNAWRLYLDHLNMQVDPEHIVPWSDKGNDLFIDLLLALSKSLGYDFDRVELKRGIYSPKAHSQIELQDQEIRENFAKLLRGELTIPISVVLPSQVVSESSPTVNAVVTADPKTITERSPN